MTAAAPILRRRPAARRRRHARLDRHRIRLGDGAATTVHVAEYDLRAFRPRVVVLDPPLPLSRWCREQGVRDALVGGFFLRSASVPLGELRVGGRVQRSEPFSAPYDRIRGCVHIDGDAVRLTGRDTLPTHPPGDLLQAGPLLVADGEPLVRDGEDPEGFSAGCRQFDSDITAGRYPRAAFGVSGSRLLAVTCDGRTRLDAGLTLGELARAMADLGASAAINLDGGGSASLVYGGRLRNQPREEHGIDLLEGRPILTAIAFTPR